MHHTDYGLNLRQAKLKTVKNPAINAIFDHSTQNSHTNPLLTLVAALLVMMAILQMDPANAEPTMDIAGYGTLQFMDAIQPTRATAMTSELNVAIEDDYLIMIVDQTFINQTAQFQHGEYVLAIPKNATINSWSVLLELCNTRFDTNEPNCQLQAKLLPQESVSNATRSGNRLHIQTPALAPNQRLSVRLDIKYPILASHFPSTTQVPIVKNDSDTVLVESVVAASKLIGPSVSGQVNSTY